ncbi:acetamidase/formamidase family protein [uncultured Roseobacter sp.]|uniref:acetamidase/formamidase family protein n=1 Tax=uncultured Roseobacter sp. TaxID=114847 RepID=UPI00261AB828|nr:acetamidase/formamidase family protein [uncultured Roseobacter sp.]
MEWLKQSIMGKKGVAGGVAGTAHRLTIEDQKTFHYVYGPYADPVLEVDPGAVVTVETHDAFEGKILSEADKPSEILQFPFLNPQSGPIHVRGAQKGDALAVRIISVTPRGPQPVGTTCLIPEFGGLVSTGQTAMLNAPLPEIVKKVVVDEDGVHWSDTLTLPYEPFIGTIGTAPEIEAISSLQPDYYGGNMDLPDVAPGAIIYLPVNTPGGYLYVGDCHAIQGDGELCGVALEIPATVELQIDLIKGHGNAWPQLETEDAMMFIGSARPLEDASRIAYRELVRWVAAQTGQSEEEAYMLLTMCGKVRLGNMVDPKYSVGASILKRYLV